ncbi:KASH domain-containing protein [Caerostris extrusa]|uniref:KASH domain-containing protein n=1 Tax=Caerostris extrusa TaxID=172846 RepID=A0AAV4XGE1_CAEEX|nr:KASH domain-containing protein [Caerostris extrusa]
MSTAAEVQVADEHNVVFEIEDDSTRTTLQCLLVGSCNEELQQPLLQWNLPVQRLSAPKLESPGKCTSQRGHSCLWRALRAALPIQCALVVLYCLSCFLEPQCCEHINTHDFSILPKLHFPGGPPPV